VDCAGIPQVVKKLSDFFETRGKSVTVGAPAPGKCAGVDVFAHLVMGRQYIGCCEGDSVPGKVCRVSPFPTSLS
jgi:Zn-dependent alcohol dehydrogenase